MMAERGDGSAVAGQCPVVATEQQPVAAPECGDSSEPSPFGVSHRRRRETTRRQAEARLVDRRCR
jgi:hypothetical protein